MKCLLALFLACFADAVTAVASTPPDNKGMEFVLMFMENKRLGVQVFNLELYCTTQEKNNVNVHITSPKWSTPKVDVHFTVKDGVVYKAEIDSVLRMEGSSVSMKGILVTADAEVACYGANKETLSNDVYLGLPVDALGTDYYAIVHNSSASSTSSTKEAEIGIASTEDGTIVKITLPLRNTENVDVTFNGTVYHGGDVITVYLDEYETLQIQSQGDLTGTHIVTNKPVAAFSGNIKTNVGKGDFADHLVEQLIPSDRWGEKFVTAPIPGRTVGDVFRIVAREDNTEVTVPGMSLITLNKGEIKVFELPSNRYHYITSTKPIIMAQFVKSQESPQEPADPSMMIIPPFEQFGSDYTFTTPEYSHPEYGNLSQYRYANEFMIVTKKADINGLLLDGKPFPTTHWTDIPGTDLAGAFITLSHGPHTVRHSDPLSTFGGYLYGHAFHESYGFPTGMRTAIIYDPNCKPTNGSVPGDGIDNDCDNRIDEELCTEDNLKKDDDNDTRVDEDCVKTTPIDGLWGVWGTWSNSCSVTCGDGVRMRYKKCDSPKPKFGGKNCTGNDSESQHCQASRSCDVDVSSLCASNSSAVVQNPNNCAQYYDCAHNSSLVHLHLFECHYPQLFNDITMKCDDFEKVSCGRRHEPQDPCDYEQNQCNQTNISCKPCRERWASCVSVDNGRQAAAVYSPSYKDCKGNRTMAMGKCDNGYFQPQLHKCVPHTINSLVFYCRQHKAELLAVPDNCAKYYNCSKTGSKLNDFINECLYPDLFSTDTGMCENFTKIMNKCSTRLEPQEPCEYDQNKCPPTNTTCQPCENIHANCTGQPDGVAAFPGKTWRQDYAVCLLNRTMSQGRCDHGYFHPVTKQCTGTVNPADVTPYCQNNPKDVIPVSTNCAKFINCSVLATGATLAGTDPIQECPYPSLFSRNTLTCQKFDTVSCDKRMEPMSPCQYDQNQCKANDPSCTQCLNRLPSCEGLSDGDHVFPGKLWKPEHITCYKNRTMLPLDKCRHGYYNPLQNNCTDVVTKVDAKAYCQANPTEILSMPDNCAHYLDCTAADPLKECTYPELFSVQSMSCQPFRMVKCAQRLEPQAPCEYERNICPANNFTCENCSSRMPSCIGIADGAQPFPTRLWTTNYVQCFKNRTVAFSMCASGTIFDPNALRCVSDVPSNRMDSYCKANPTAIKEDPDNCARYYNCSDNATLFGLFKDECHYPDLFSNVLKTCSPFETVACASRKEPKAPCDYQRNICTRTNSTCIPCSERLPSCDGRADGNHSFPTMLWTSEYIICSKERTVAIKQCPNGYFHPVLNMCMTTVSRNDGKLFCRGNPTSIVPTTDNCAQLINCTAYTAGVIVDPIQECTYPQLFSETILSCQDFKKVTCNTRPEPKAPCSYQQNICDFASPSCSPCPDRLPSCVNLSDGNHAFPSRMWKADYITCDNERTVIPTMKCTKGYFHPVQQVCLETVSDTDSNQYCQANPGDTLPVTTNCAKFFNCTAALFGEDVKQECHYPKLYSIISMICQDFTTVLCDKRPEPQAPCEYDQNICPATDSNCAACPQRLPSCVGLPDGNQPATGYKWTDKFVSCYKNRTIAVNQCPNGAVFNPTRLTCVSKIKTADIASYCHSNPSAITPHETNCAQYFNCSNEHSALGSFLQECPYPDLFSTVSGRCDKFESVPCGTRQEPQAPCEYIINHCDGSDISCRPCPERQPSCVGLSDGPNAIAGKEWMHEYVECNKNRTVRVLQCRPGYFHPVMKICTDVVNRADVPRFCKKNPSAVLPAEDNCAQYFNCSSPVSALGAYVGECKYPMLFSRTSSACRPFTQTLCDTRSEPQAPCQYEQNQCHISDFKCTPCLERFSSCIGLPDGDHADLNHLWTNQFIRCFLNRTMSMKTCKDGFFHPRQQQCRTYVDPVDVPDYCKVHTSDMISSRDSCAVYFNCSSTDPIKECMYPDLYDDAMRTCRNFRMVDCHTRPVPQAPCEYRQNLCAPKDVGCTPCPDRLPSCIGFGDGNYAMPNRVWGPEYITCSKNRTVSVTKCQLGYFHPIIQTCTTNVDSADLLPYCHAHPNAITYNPDNCAKYVNCSMSSAQTVTIKECPYPDLFDADSLACAPFTKVRCDKRKETQDPCDYDQNQCAPNDLNCTPCSQRFPSCVGIPDGARPFTGREWTEDYIECYKNRTMSIIKCPVGSFFDPDQSACVSKINKSSVQSFCQFNQNSLMEHPDNCAQYFDCSQHSSSLGPYLMECNYPKLFSASLLRCVEFEQVQCGRKTEPQTPCDYLRNLCSTQDLNCIPCRDRFPSCSGVEDGPQPYSNRAWQADYIICRKNRTISIENCQHGYFHPQQRACVDTINQAHIGNYCQVHANNIAADPDNCARYFNCSNPNSPLGPYREECRYPDLFSPTFQSCMQFDSVRCQTRPEPMSPCDYLQNQCSSTDLGCIPCSKRFASCEGKQDGDNLYPGHLWTQDYIVCQQNRTVSVGRCRQGYFNPRTSMCESKVAQADVYQYCQSHPHDVLSHPGSCAQYYSCPSVLVSSIQIQECKYPDLFSEVTFTCLPFEMVDCTHRKEPQTPCEYLQNQCPVNDHMCTPCATRFSSCAGLSDGPHPIGLHDWSQEYIVCLSNRTKDVIKCPGGSFFSAHERRCSHMINPSDSSSFCGAHPTIVQPHSTNCAQYYDCSSATLGGDYLKECPYPNLFDSVTLTCKNFTDVQCGIRIEPTSPCDYMANHCSRDQSFCQPCTQRLPSCTGLSDGNQPITGMLWQQKYVFCYKNRMMSTHACPGLTVFNPNTKQCIDMMSIKTNEIMDYCNAYPDAVLPDPNDCSRYYQCRTLSLRGTSNRQCFYPDLFSNINKRCEEYNQVQCGTRPEPISPCQYDHYQCTSANSSCVPCEISHPDCKGLPDGDNGIPGMLWSVNYVKCQTGRTIEVKRCVQGVFDPNLKACSIHIGPQHIKDMCLANPRAVIPHPSNCAQYFDCSQDSTRFGHYLMECNYPLYFDEHALQCRNPTDVQCGSKLQPRAPCQYFQNLCPVGNHTCTPCNIRLPSCVGLPDGLNPVPGRFWSVEYIDCFQDRTVFTNTCRKGYFDPSNRLCTLLVQPGDVPQFCRSNPGAVIPNPNDCGSYFNCSNAVSNYNMECTYPQLFSDQSSQCDAFQSVLCGVRTEPQAPCEYSQNHCEPGDASCIPCQQRLPSCRGLPDGINPVPGRLWSNMYVQCQRNRTITTQQCRVGIFNPTTRSCTADIEPNKMDEICRANPNELYPDPSNCAKFYDCRSFKEFTFLSSINKECQYPNLFSTVTYLCEHFNDVRCGNRYEPQAPCEYTANICTDSGRQPSCVGLPDGNNGVLSRLWTGDYVQCFRNRTLAVTSCQTPLIFDPVYRKCVKYVEQEHAQDYCKYHPTARYPSSRNAAQYFDCSHLNTPLGVPYLQECSYPDLFDISSRSCRGFTTVPPDQRPQPQAPCQYQSNQCSPIDPTCVPCPQRFSSCIGLPDGLNAIEGKSWIPEYVICSLNRTTGTDKCLQGVFDPNKRQCVAQTNTVPVSLLDQCRLDTTRLIPHPGSCALYYNCSKTLPTFGPSLPVQLDECHYPDLYSEEFQRCLDFQSVNCNNRHEVIAPCQYLQNHCDTTNVTCASCTERLPSCIGFPDGENPVIGKYWSRDYIYCFKERTFAVTQCQHGVFNPNTKKCNDGVDQDNLDQYCRNHPTEKIAKEDNCAQYYDCSNVSLRSGIHMTGAASYEVQECTYPELFSTALQKCGPFNQVSCNNRREPQAPCEYDQNLCHTADSTCIPCSKRLPSCVGLPNGLQAVPGNEYSDTYLTCKQNRTLIVNKCQSGFFDATLRTCVTKINSANIASYCQQNPGSIIPHPLNCAWYYNCSITEQTLQSVYPFDVKYVQECPYPELFSAAMMRCERYQSVSCNGHFEPQAPCEYFKNRCDPTHRDCIPCPNRIPSCKSLSDGQQIITNLYDGLQYLVNCNDNRTISYEVCKTGSTICKGATVQTTWMSLLTTVATTRTPQTIYTPATAKNDDPMALCRANPYDVIASTTNCAQYYDCQDIFTSNVILAKECQYPLLFSPRIRACSNFNSVHCGSKYEPQAPCEYERNQCHVAGCVPCTSRFMSCIGLSDGHHAYPGNTSIYIRCEKNRTIATEYCSLGTFDPLSRQCMATTPASSGDKITEHCRTHGNDVLPDPDNCAQYYTCNVPNTPLGHYKMECQYPKLFDGVLKLCQDRVWVRCEQRKIPQTECDYQLYQCIGLDCMRCQNHVTVAPHIFTTSPVHITKHVTNPPVVLTTGHPTCVGHPDGLNPYPGLEFTEKYIVCENGYVTEINICNVDTILDPNRRICSDPASPDIIGAYCSAKPGTSIPSLSNCAQYYKCGNDITNSNHALEECVYPQLYSTIASSCRPFRQVQCGQRYEPITPCDYKQYQCDQGDPTCTPCEQRMPSCLGQTAGAHPYPNTQMSADYIICDNGRTVNITRCQTGYFNPTYSACSV